VSFDVGALRAREFPWTGSDRTYLNNASTGPLPRRTIAAIDAMNHARAEPFRVRDAELFALCTRARAACARLVGGAASEIALMVNTSYGINLAARALPLEPGDVVLGLDGEFPANVYPWMALEQAKGVTLRQLPLAGGLPDEEALLRALDDPAVKVLALSWVQFATGYRADLTTLGRHCRDRGIHFVVDAIQGLGAAQLDVRACGIDVLACGGQKWLLSPWGSGFTWVRRELIEQMPPSAVGWMAVRGSDDFARLTEYDLTWRDDARRFEVITLPYQDIAGFAASLELLEEVGHGAVERQVQSLADRIVARARASRALRLVTPADRAHRAGIVALAPADPADTSRRLTSAGVSHSLREGMIRLSPHLYNTLEEIDRAMDVLEA
jgi:selenocysteine lyase/cysteine desulfurase